MGIWNMIGVSRGRLITTSNWFELCGGDVGAGCDILVPSELRLGNFLTQILKRIPRGERCSLKFVQHSEPSLRVPICQCDLERKWKEMSKSLKNHFEGWFLRLTENQSKLNEFRSKQMFFSTNQPLLLRILYKTWKLISAQIEPSNCVFWWLNNLVHWRGNTFY